MGARTRHNVSAEQAGAYRVAAHHLHDRLPARSLVDAAATSGIQDTPPGSAAVALAARVDRLRPSDVEEALLDDRSLIRLMGLRGAAHVVPRRDGTVFGPGALAADEESLREQLQGSWPALEARDWTALEALGVVVGALAGVVAAARHELVRRFVHAFGPAGPRQFAAWTGMGAVEARDRFERLRPELVEVKLDGVVGWMLSDDLAAIDDPPMAAGARLLPTGDPFLAQRDRSTLLPDRAAQRAVWRPSGSPGLVLLTGRPMATWRARVAAGRLDVAVEPFTKLSDRQRWAVEQEAAVIAPFRGRELASVTFTDREAEHERREIVGVGAG